MISREEALKFLNEKIENKNIVTTSRICGSWFASDAGDSSAARTIT